MPSRTYYLIEVPWLMNFNRFVLFTAIKNVAFFFSAISAQGHHNNRGKKRANRYEEESEESNDEGITLVLVRHINQTVKGNEIS